MGNQAVECGGWEIRTNRRIAGRVGAEQNPERGEELARRNRKCQSLVMCMSKQSEVIVPSQDAYGQSGRRSVVIGNTYLVELVFQHSGADRGGFFARVIRHLC